MKGSETTFEFPNLPKLSRAHLALANVFSANHIDIDLINKTLSDILTQLEPFPSDKLSLVFKSCWIDSQKKALSLLGKESLCVLGDFSNQNIPFALEIPERAVIELVYLLLGSQADVPSKKTALTAIEEGIFSFILSIVVNALQKHFASIFGTSVHFGPLEKCTRGNEFFASHSQVLTLAFELGVDNSRSQIRVLVSAEPIPSLIKLNETIHDNASVVRRGMRRASEVKSICTANIGQFSLQQEDLKALEVDDIVVLESSRVTLNGKVLSGELDCHFGDPLFAKANAQLSLLPDGAYSIRFNSLRPVVLPVGDF